MTSTKIRSATGKVLVTGASGFVGRALCEELLHHGYVFRAAIRRPGLIWNDIETVLVNAIDCDTEWYDALSDVEVIIHLAARVHVMKDKTTNPLAEFLRVNLMGTENLAYQAVRSGVKRFVYVSSVKVNGETTEGRPPFTEIDQADPNDHYGVSKWKAEQALRRIAQETGLEVVIVRPPLVYGPGVKANFASLLKLVDMGMPLPMSAIRNARSLIYLGNLVDGLIACATHPAAAGQTYQISDGEDVSTPQLIEAIAVALDRPNRNLYAPVSLLRGVAALLGKSDAIDRLTQPLVVDSSKICRELDWRPPYKMSEGLRMTAAWYRQSKIQ